VKRACELRHVLQSARISSVRTGWIFLQFCFGGFYQNLTRKFEVWLKLDKNVGHFHEGLSKM